MGKRDEAGHRRAEHGKLREREHEVSGPADFRLAFAQPVALEIADTETDPLADAVPVSFPFTFLVLCGDQPQPYPHPALAVRFAPGVELTVAIKFTVSVKLTVGLQLIVGLKLIVDADIESVGVGLPIVVPVLRRGVRIGRCLYRYQPEQRQQRQPESEPERHGCQDPAVRERATLAVQHQARPESLLRRAGLHPERAGF